MSERQNDKLVIDRQKKTILINGVKLNNVIGVKFSDINRDTLQEVTLKLTNVDIEIK